MPRPGPRLPTVCIRLSPATLAQVDATAAADSRTRSDMIRVLLAEALAARGVRAYDVRRGALAALDPGQDMKGWRYVGASSVAPRDPDSGGPGVHGGDTT